MKNWPLIPAVLPRWDLCHLLVRPTCCHDVRHLWWAVHWGVHAFPTFNHLHNVVSFHPLWTRQNKGDTLRTTLEWYLISLFKKKKDNLCFFACEKCDVTTNYITITSQGTLWFEMCPSRWFGIWSWCLNLNICSYFLLFFLSVSITVLAMKLHFLHIFLFI